jgi:two-component system response regulator DesR
VIDPTLAAAALMEGPNPLTEREQEVLKRAAAGATAPQIATELFLSAGTVRNYLSEAIQKVGGRNSIEAARIAEQKGWL